MPSAPATARPPRPGNRHNGPDRADRGVGRSGKSGSDEGSRRTVRSRRDRRSRRDGPRAFMVDTGVGDAPPRHAGSVESIATIDGRVCNDEGRCRVLQTGEAIAPLREGFGCRRRAIPRRGHGDANRSGRAESWRATAPSLSLPESRRAPASIDEKPMDDIPHPGLDQPDVVARVPPRGPGALPVQNCRERRALRYTLLPRSSAQRWRRASNS